MALPKRSHSGTIATAIEILIKTVSSTLACMLIFALGEVRAQDRPPTTSAEYVNEATSAWQKGDNHRSIELCEKALQIDPASKEALRLIGHNYWQLKDFPKAAVAYDKYLAVDPGDAQVWAGSAAGFFWMARAKLEIKTKEANSEALKLLNNMEHRLSQAETIDPNNSHLLMNRGTNYLLLGQYTKSNRAFARLKELGKERTYLTWTVRLLRIIEGKDGPKADWVPDYASYHTVVGLASDPGFLVNMNPKPGTLFTFEGSEQVPFEYAPNFYVWNGAVLWDKNADCILRDGTHYRHVIQGSEGIRVIEGVVTGWKASPTKTESYPTEIRPVTPPQAPLKRRPVVRPTPAKKQ